VINSSVTIFEQTFQRHTLLLCGQQGPSVAQIAALEPKPLRQVLFPNFQARFADESPVMFEALPGFLVEIDEGCATTRIGVIDCHRITSDAPPSHGMSILGLTPKRTVVDGNQTVS
jgi:hypothetical protein